MFIIVNLAEIKVCPILQLKMLLLFLMVVLMTVASCNKGLNTNNCLLSMDKKPLIILGTIYVLVHVEHCTNLWNKRIWIGTYCLTFIYLNLTLESRGIWIPMFLAQWSLFTQNSLIGCFRVHKFHDIQQLSALFELSSTWVSFQYYFFQDGVTVKTPPHNLVYEWIFTNGFVVLHVSVFFTAKKLNYYQISVCYLRHKYIYKAKPSDIVTSGGLLMKNRFQRPCFPPSKQSRNSWLEWLNHFKGKLTCQLPTATLVLFQNADKLLNVRALKFASRNKTHIFHFWVTYICVEFESMPFEISLKISFIHWKIRLLYSVKV